jgi:hypothetical protein
VGQWRQFWGIYSANEAWLLAESDDRHRTGRAGQTDKQWTNELLAMCKWAKRQNGGAAWLTPLGSSTGLEQAFVAPQPTCPFVREATLLPNTPAAMHSSNAPCPPRLPCLVVIAPDWRNIHPHQPLPRDPSVTYFWPPWCAKIVPLELKAHLNLL